MPERRPEASDGSGELATRGVIFDLGGVVVDLERDAFRARITTLLGDFDSTELHAIFDRLQRGELDEPAFAADLRQHAGRADLTDAELTDAWRMQIGSVPCARVEVMQRVRRAGFRTGILSTTNAPHVEEIQRAMRPCLPDSADPLRDSVDRAFLTFEMGMLKPDRGIYEAVVAEMGLAPSQLLFLDDSPKNVLGAREAGWRALLIEGPGWVDWLPGLLGIEHP